MRAAIGCLLLFTNLALAGEDRPAIDRLMRDLGAEDHRVRDQAEQGLAQLGAAALPVLREQKNSPDPEIRFRVQRLLAAAGPDVRGFLASRGSCTGQAEEGQTVWPCVVKIEEFDSVTGAFRGTVEWTTLKALHAIEGKLDGDKLEFRETKFIRRGNAMLNTAYEFATKPKVAGTWRDLRSGRSGPAQLNLGDF